MEDARHCLLAEHVTYGKVVAHSHRVPNWSPYGITRRSSGLCVVDPEAITPQELLGLGTIKPEMIAPTFARIGALVGRTVSLPGIGGGAALDAFALLRFRFRPEGGDDSFSRANLQARCLIIDRGAWAEGAVSVLSHHAAGLRAEPDMVSGPDDLNLSDAPVRLSLRTSGVTGDSAPVAAIGRIFNWIESPPAVLELGDESVPDETEFLRLLASAYRAAPLQFGSLKALGFSAGYEGPHPERWIRYLPARNCLAKLEPNQLALEEVMTEFILWQRLLVSSALCPEDHDAGLLFEKTRDLNAMFAGMDAAERIQIEALLPRRERAFMRLMSAAAGWSGTSQASVDDMSFAKDVGALIERLSKFQVWRPAHDNARRQAAA